MKANHLELRAFETAGGASTAASTCVAGCVARPSLPLVARSITAGALLAFFRAYQIFLSPILGGACKFYPSCSNYAYEAVARHGARRGLVLALKRLGRCRPFTKGGVDLVPDADELPALSRGRRMVSPAPSHATAFRSRSLQISTETESKQ